jgi:anti-anti-sigma factor
MASVSASIAQIDDMTIVSLAGDLTGAAVMQAESCLAPLLRQVPPRLVVDLSGLRTCDATGALILEIAACVATECGGEVRLAAAGGAVCRTLRQAGTMRMVRTFGTVPGAVRAELLDLLATPADSVERDTATAGPLPDDR